MAGSISKLSVPFLIVAGVFALLGQSVLAVVVVLLWILALAVVTMRTTAVQRQADPRDDMDAQSRSLYAPIRRLADEIEELVQRNSDSAIMKVVGGEASQEAFRIRDQVAKALAVRDDLRRAMKDRNATAAEIESLKAKAAASDLPAEKASLLSAVEARQIELSHYSEVEEAIARIDAGVTQASAALSEMKAKLAMKVSTHLAASATDDDSLRETMSRMKDLSISYDEAEQLLSS